MILKTLLTACLFPIVFAAEECQNGINLGNNTYSKSDYQLPAHSKKVKYTETQSEDKQEPLSTLHHDIFIELQTQNLTTERRRGLTLKLYESSTNPYNLSAIFHLARCMEIGLLSCNPKDSCYCFIMLGTPDQRNQRIVKIYQNLSTQNYIPAIFRLAKIYSRPESYNKDLLIFYLTKAAELNDPEANFFLATLYHTATHAEQNGALALKHYTIASNLGFAEATYRLAEIYRSGILVKKSMARAYELYQKAADQGSFKAMVQVLTQRIVHGDNVTDCIQKLHTLHQKGIIEATYILGTFYESTTYSGLLYDTDKAFSFFHNAARRNHAKSQYIIGSYYHKGIAPQQSHTDYPMLAEEFNLEVDNLLPIHRFESPTPLLTDDDFSWEILPSQYTLQFRKAVFWLKQSAENGHIPAKFLLARILLNSSTEVFDQQQSKDLLESIPHQDLIRLLINYMDKNPE